MPSIVYIPGIRDVYSLLPNSARTPDYSGKPEYRYSFFAFQAGSGSIYSKVYGTYPIFLPVATDEIS